jgi:hypothetical protein
MHFIAPMTPPLKIYSMLLVRDGDNKPALYEVSTDISETKDLSAETRAGDKPHSGVETMGC